MRSLFPTFRCGLGVLAAVASMTYPSNVALGKHEKKQATISEVQEGKRLDLVKDPPDLENANINFIGQIVGNYKYLIVRQPGNRADIAVYYKGKPLFSVPDEKIDVASEWEPGEADNGYDFYMSPDRRYLFVDRYLISHLDVALLYKKSCRRWMAAGPIRFDEAALQAYCRSRHIDPDDLAGPSRRVRLVRWDLRRGMLVFRMAAASFWFSDEAQRGDMAADWTASYRLNDMRFHIISGKTYRFTKPGRFGFTW